MSEENNQQNLITLCDEDGVEHIFEQIDYINIENKEYVALVPYFEDAEDAMDYDGELVIMKVVEEGDDAILSIIEDDDEFNEIAELFMQRLSSDFDFEDLTDHSPEEE